jgi:hypothetical protein
VLLEEKHISEKLMAETRENEDDGEFLLDDIRKLDNEISGIKDLLLQNGINM